VGHRPPERCQRSRPRTRQSAQSARGAASRCRAANPEGV